VVVDLSGQSLGLGAELSVLSSLASASDTLVLAKVERVQGIPYVAVVALAQLVGERIVSQPYPGLPGVVTEGRYVFFRVGGPIGFVSGTATAAGAPVRALVETDARSFRQAMDRAEAHHRLSERSSRELSSQIRDHVSRRGERLRGSPQERGHVDGAGLSVVDPERQGSAGEGVEGGGHVEVGSQELAHLGYIEHPGVVDEVRGHGHGSASRLGRLCWIGDHVLPPVTRHRALGELPTRACDDACGEARAGPGAP
jgi:hypothetical protein